MLGSVQFGWLDGRCAQRCLRVRCAAGRSHASRPSARSQDFNACAECDGAAQCVSCLRLPSPYRPASRLPVDSPGGMMSSSQTGSSGSSQAQSLDSNGTSTSAETWLDTAAQTPMASTAPRPRIRSPRITLPRKMPQLLPLPLHEPDHAQPPRRKRRRTSATGGAAAHAVARLNQQAGAACDVSAACCLLSRTAAHRRTPSATHRLPIAQRSVPRAGPPVPLLSLRRGRSTRDLEVIHASCAQY